MLENFIWVLVAVVNLHGTITREHVAVYGKDETCQQARRSVQYYSADRMYFCQKETIK